MSTEWTESRSDPGIFNSSARWDRVIDFIVIMSIFHCLGFPGSYDVLIGDRLYFLMDYALFALEIVLMIYTSSSDLISVKLLDLKRQYWPIYLFVAVVFIESVCVASSFQDEFIRCLHFSTTVFYAIWMMERYDLLRLLELFVRAQNLIVISCIAMIFLSYNTAFVSGDSAIPFFTGIFRVKNECGSELSFGIILQLVYFTVSRRKGKSIPRSHLLFFVFDVMFLFLTQATGSIITTLAASLFILLAAHSQKTGRSKTRQGHISFGVLYIAVSVLFVVVVFTILPLFKPILDTLGKDITLSGRTVIWKRVMDIMLRHHTWTGWGYFNFWRERKSLAMVHMGFREYSFFRKMDYGAHNDLFELWANIGLIGLRLYYFLLIYAFRDMKRLTDDEYLFCGSIMILETVHGLTERTFTINLYQTQMLFVVLAAACRSMWIHREKPQVYRRRIGGMRADDGRQT